MRNSVAASVELVAAVHRMATWGAAGTATQRATSPTMAVVSIGALCPDPTEFFTLSPYLSENDVERRLPRTASEAAVLLEIGRNRRAERERERVREEHEECERQRKLEERERQDRKASATKMRLMELLPEDYHEYIERVPLYTVYSNLDSIETAVASGNQRAAVITLRMMCASAGVRTQPPSVTALPPKVLLDEVLRHLMAITNAGTPSDIGKSNHNVVYTHTLCHRSHIAPELR
eukprot:m51a1_g11563 hypothetical protein (235) ;mRNA; f:1151-2235